MRKLRLEIDALVVESFDALPSRGEGRGTVAGHGFVLSAEYGTCVAPCPPPTRDCALSDDDGTCLLTCAQPGCGSADLVLCLP